MAAINTPIINNAGAATGKAFTQPGISNNNTTQANLLKPCFKPGCALNCKHKAAACFKAATQQAC